MLAAQRTFTGLLQQRGFQRLELQRLGPRDKTQAQAGGCQERRRAAKRPGSRHRNPGEVHCGLDVRRSALRV